MLSLNKFGFLKIILLLVVIICSGCGPGAKDGSVHIAGGYYFSHLGGDQNLIEYIKDDNSEIIVRAKVEDFNLFQDKIFVSRFPVIYQKDNGVLKSTLSSECEYWIINLKDNTVKGPIEKQNVKHLIKGCKWLKSKY